MYAINFLAFSKAIMWKWKIVLLLCIIFTLSSVISLTLGNTRFPTHIRRKSDVSFPKIVRRTTSFLLAHEENPHTTLSSPNIERGEGEKRDIPSLSSPSYYISEETINEIKSYADIVTVIESYNLAQFTKNLDGNRATALCPFHDDTNPSLTIDKSKGLYKCFSCGAGGDVFNFVREYDSVIKGRKGGKGEQSKMSFPVAVKKVAEDYCNGSTVLSQINFSSLDYSKGGRSSNDDNMSPAGRQRRERNKKRRERILLANSAAADYYAKLLITLPSAGSARTHLLQRGVSPETVRTFAFGYAPDAYFGSTARDQWGKCSCVERLKELGFSPDEIIDSGLATVTSAARRKLSDKNGRSVLPAGMEDDISTSIFVENTESQKNKSDNQDKKKVELQYSDLMDRFRGRLMIPIFDAPGRNIVGFGGRHIDTPAFESTSVEKDRSEGKRFKAAKYLNSPETPVFVKKNLLFGLHSAQAALNEEIVEEKTDEENNTMESNDFSLQFKSPASDIVIVEGYFDAVALYAAGIREVVASMGAALSIKQLEAAANAVSHGGKIILCLDADDAGINAIERLCSGTTIWDILQQFPLDILVANIPYGYKDPAEFIEANGGAEFRTKVLKKAILWSDWYISHLISHYEADDTRSFSDVSDRVTTFLSSFSNAADRTKRAYEAAGILADRIAQESDRSPSSDALRMQLESDLLGMSSRKAVAKEALERRIESKEGVMNTKRKTLIAKMSSGDGITFIPEKETKKTSDSLNGDTSNYEESIPKERPIAKAFSKNLSNNVKGNKQKKFDKKRQRQRPFIEHFSGFTFNPSDAVWMGLSGQEVSIFKRI